MYRFSMIAALLLTAAPLAAQDAGDTAPAETVAEDTAPAATIDEPMLGTGIAGADDPADPALADPSMADPSMAQAGMPLIRAESVSDASIYSLDETYDETFWDSGEPFGHVATAWSQIGEVEDLVIDRNAQVVGVTVDVGGFLGIGQKTVLLSLEDIRLVQLPDQNEFFLVTRVTEDQLTDSDEIEGLIGD